MNNGKFSFSMTKRGGWLLGDDTTKTQSRLVVMLLKVFNEKWENENESNSFQKGSFLSSAFLEQTFF